VALYFLLTNFQVQDFPFTAKIATQITAVSVLLYACMPGFLRKHAAYYNAQYRNLISGFKKSA